MAHLFTVSNSGNTNYTFETEKEANDFFEKHTNGHQPLWMFREVPFQMIREYDPKF